MGGRARGWGLLPPPRAHLNARIMATRVRFFSLVTYLSEQEFLPILQDTSHIRNYIYIYHNKDKCAPHYHICLNTFNNHTPTAVCKWFKKPDVNTFNEEIHSSNIFGYLTHSLPNDKDKFHYSESELRSNDIEFWRRFSPTADIAQSIIADLLDGKSLREMLSLYGREFVLNYNKYRYFASMVSSEICSETFVFSKTGDVVTADQVDFFPNELPTE